MPPLSVNAPSGASPVGYAWLVQRYRLVALPSDRWSFVAAQGSRQIYSGDRTVRVVHPAGFRVPASMQAAEHIEFSLRYDGVALSILCALFSAAPELREELTAWVPQKPTGKYTRRMWFLYEFLTGTVLDIPNLGQGNYVPLLDPGEYFTGQDLRSARHRVTNNLLGVRGFSPMVRRSEALQAANHQELKTQLQTMMVDYDQDALRRAVRYLYTRETRASFEMEREKPTASRVERFVSMLHRVTQITDLNRSLLIAFQNTTVDKRFADQGYRDEQVYVGESLSLHRQQIHYVAPRAEDVEELMGALLRVIQRSGDVILDPVVWAAVVSFGFVYIHPFTDGNGRLHRMLIHYILSRQGFTPPGMIVPVSSVMLSQRREYDAVLERTSRPLMGLLEYDLDEDGILSIEGETADLYRYLDLTELTEALYRWLQQSIEEDLLAEVQFVARFREARAVLEEIVEIPDLLLNRFVQLCLLGKGRLSKKKRKRHFGMLSDEEIAQMEAVVAGILSESE